MENHSLEDMNHRKEVFDRNYTEVLSRIERAARSVGRDPSEIRLLAATKTIPVQVINYAVSKGITLIGENRVQEFLSKEKELDATVERHFIGRLQTNKVRQIVGKVSLIHSVDSLHLAQEIDKRSEALGLVSNILVEVNVGEEASKSGISVEETEQLIRQLAKFNHIHVCGLMAIPPICETEGEISLFFAQMSKLYIDIAHKNIDNIDMKYLSMGMSSDFEQAIRAGANLIRLGTILFGDRNYDKK